MKTPKWTKADDKRAAKMGWKLTVPNHSLAIQKLGDRFKDHREAIEWVIEKVQYGYTNDHQRTCRKAMFLCMWGCQ